MLSALDIIILAVLLALSLGIGLYQARTGGHQHSTAEFIHGNRKLRFLPTLLSLLVSNQSAISVLYAPAEYYRWGTGMWFGTELFQALTCFVSSQLFVPFFYRLQVTSIYEYLGLRFNNDVLRRFISLISVFASSMYMATCVLGPSIALSTMTGFPVPAGILLMVGCCALYTALGGIKAVVWTDLVQGITMIVGLCIIFIGACNAVGGIDTVFKTGAENGRLYFANYEFNLKTRTTLWSSISNGFFTGLMMYSFDQGTMQRVTSLPALPTARSIMIVLMPCVIMYSSLCFFVGAGIFAFFAVNKCDPFKMGYIESPNELLPLFVRTYFNNAGIKGLFLAVLYSASLSSVSTSMSCAAVVVWQDICKPFFKNVSDQQAALANKLLVLCFAGLAAGITFLISNISGNLYQVLSILASCLYGPRGAVFALAVTYHRVKWQGAIVGMIASGVFTAFIAYGSLFSHGTVLPLPSLDTAGCANITGLEALHMVNHTISTMTQHVVEPKGIEKLYTISFQWYSVIGFITCLLVTIIASEVMQYFSSETMPKIPDELMISFKDMCSLESFYAIPNLCKWKHSKSTACEGSEKEQELPLQCKNDKQSDNELKELTDTNICKI